MTPTLRDIHVIGILIGGFVHSQSLEHFSSHYGGWIEKMCRDQDGFADC